MTANEPRRRANPKRYGTILCNQSDLAKLRDASTVSIANEESTFLKPALPFTRTGREQHSRPATSTWETFHLTKTPKASTFPPGYPTPQHCQKEAPRPPAAELYPAPFPKVPVSPSHIESKPSDAQREHDRGGPSLEKSRRLPPPPSHKSAASRLAKLLSRRTYLPNFNPPQPKSYAKPSPSTILSAATPSRSKSYSSPPKKTHTNFSSRQSAPHTLSQALSKPLPRPPASPSQIQSTPTPRRRRTMLQFLPSIIPRSMMPTAKPITPGPSARASRNSRSTPVSQTPYMSTVRKFQDADARELEPAAPILQESTHLLQRGHHDRVTLNPSSLGCSQHSQNTVSLHRVNRRYVSYSPHTSSSRPPPLHSSQRRSSYQASDASSQPPQTPPCASATQSAAAQAAVSRKPKLRSKVLMGLPNLGPYDFGMVACTPFFQVEPIRMRRTHQPKLVITPLVKCVRCADIGRPCAYNARALQERFNLGGFVLPPCVTCRDGECFHRRAGKEFVPTVVVFDKPQRESLRLSQTWRI